MIYGRKVFTTALALLALTGCTTAPEGAGHSRIEEAVRLQNSVIADPLFREILLELDHANIIEWGTDSLTTASTQEAAGHPSRTQWLLARYVQSGGFAVGVITTWRKWNPWSATTAVTVPGRNATRLNRWNLPQDAHDIAPTLVHERVHSFGQKHLHGQYKQPNQCDAAYVAGDLAEALLARSRPENIREPNVCPALCNALRRRNLPFSSTCPG